MPEKITKRLIDRERGVAQQASSVQNWNVGEWVMFGGVRWKFKRLLCVFWAFQSGTTTRLAERDGWA